MTYNLIDQRWIPVRRRSGVVEYISPAEIVDTNDPPLRIESPRPDFDGALLEFLIGLLQTAAAPASETAWEKEFKTPPAVADLKKRFDTVRDSFNLDGDGPRFMQDLKVGTDPNRAEKPIGLLLIDRVGESELDEAPNLFAKPNLIPRIGYPALAAALMSFQTYSPAGGRGQLTSLRGGGPLTTAIQGATLWQTSWLNVLPLAEIKNRIPGNSDLTAPSDIFPWMGPTRTSEKKGGVSTPPQTVNPLQHFWGLPRRFRIKFEGSADARCAITGIHGPTAAIVETRPDGTSYDGDYRHPLTPYSEGKPGEPWNPRKGSADGAPYRDWPLWVTGSAKRRPATIVQYFASTRRGQLVDDQRLIVFGYAMDKMKPLNWSRGETPLITVSPELSAQFSETIGALVEASESVRLTFSGQVRAAWSDRPGDLEVFERCNPAFWSRTESAFFSAVRQIKQAIESDSKEEQDRAKEAWLRALHKAALVLFDEFVSLSPDTATTDMRRAIEARRSLINFTRPGSKSLRKVLSLPVEDESTTTAKTRKPKKEARK